MEAPATQPNRALTKAIGLELRSLVTSLVDILRMSRVREFVLFVVAVIASSVTALAAGRFLDWSMSFGYRSVDIALVVLYLMLLVVWAGLISNEEFFGRLLRNGFEWPTVLSVGLVWFSSITFGGLSCVLWSGDAVVLHRSGEPVQYASSTLAQGCAMKVADVYVWNFLKSIPIVDVTGTIGWTEELQFKDTLSGWILLAFKIVVIVPVIKSFAVTATLRRERREALRAGSLE